MTDSEKIAEDIRESINLKLPLATVSKSQPWSDDVLHRSQLAAALTNLVKNQTNPFTISIHGNWGTGKTFLLQRWQQDLQDLELPALYFNAWEDDFCDDPLLAILGQLSEYFKEPRLTRLGSMAIDAAVEVLQQTAQTLLKSTTGLSVEMPQSESSTLLDQYLDQRRAKDQLKEHLTCLAEAIRCKTGYPLVFIIDELDRCRPTFAIELLEKVKHIFDIQHMVFVFGINRVELSKSVQSIYGEIDAATYLRRFFDIEFSLPEADAAVFCRHVMDRFGLQEIFAKFSSAWNLRLHSDEYRVLSDIAPIVWSRFGLSLRDIENCVASIAFVTRNLGPRYRVHPAMLVLLIPIRLKNRSLYDRFVQHQCFASEIIDYSESLLSSQQWNSGDSQAFDWVEAYLYFVEEQSVGVSLRSSTATVQLRLLGEGKPATNPEYLSERVKTADRERASGLLSTIEGLGNLNWAGGDVVQYVASLVDLHQGHQTR